MLSAGRPYYERSSPTLLADEPANDDGPQKPAPDWLGWQDLYLHLEARRSAMWNWRLPWWEVNGEIARYLLPRRWQAFVTANTFDRGRRRDANIVDSTATLDGQTSAGGLMSVLSDQDRPWYKIGPAQPGLELDRAGQIWFDDLTERLRYVQAESNFYESLAQEYEDLIFFGTGVAIDYEDGDDIFQSQNPCAGEFFLASGSDLSSESLYVDDRRTVAQIVEMFGLENCSGEIRQRWMEKGGALETEFVVAHAIEPNFAIEKKGGGKCGQIPGGFTWREVYWVLGKAGEGPLSIAGFHEKPHSVMGWHKQSNDPYFRGPGWTALGDTIQLQLETRQKAEALEKLIRPPMGADPALKNEPHSIKPGQITYYDTSTGKKGFHSLFEVKPDIAAITADIMDIRTRIGRALHADLFRVIQQVSLNTKRDVSATEIDALRQELLMQLGPMIGRVYKYGIRPRFARQLSIMERRGLLPPRPPSVRGMPLKLEFISMLTLAQRASATGAIERTFGFTGNIAGAYPQAKDVLDPDEAIREYADLRGMPSRIVRAPQVVQAMRDAQAKQAQAAAATQAAMAAVQGAQVLSKTDAGGGQSGLAAILGSAGNQ